MKAYSELERRFHRLAMLDGAGAVLHWDSAVMMPAGGAGTRGEQLATLALLGHELLTDPRLADLLDRAEADRDALDPWQSANLREMRRRWRHGTALPADLVEARSKAASTCEMVWRDARADDDFARLAPHLDHVLALTREVAAAKADAFGCSPYDALLDGFEPGGESAKIDAVFQELEEKLPPLLGRILDRQSSLPAMLPLEGPFPVEAQRQLGVTLMEALGFDFHHGRLDVSLHPFTGGVPDDVRITTRYSEADFAESLMGTLHETGHALYERGLPSRWRGQPVGEARGMALHESQSLLIEMQLCRSREYLGFAAPLMRKAFGAGGPAWELDNLCRHYHRVEPGLIRVDADEVTYPLHVILRYRLERAMLDGDLAVADLPGAWREGMRESLGVAPDSDRDGCLQDIHWPDGAFGYFPTYTLGALAAAQLFQAVAAQMPGLASDIAQGEFSGLVDWLRRNVHQSGSRYGTDEVMVAATGRELSAAAFLSHLEKRYLAD